MIKYKLICKTCNISFDSWFASSGEFERLKKRKFLNCHECNSTKIEKTLMAPKLNTRSDSNKRTLKYKKINDKLREYQKFIKNNFDYVGKNFAHKARSIHYRNKKNEKGIYGIASKEEIKELKEEGIETETIPWVRDKVN